MTAARELAGVEALLRVGHPDITGLCRAVVDWSLATRLDAGDLTEADLRRQWEESQCRTITTASSTR